MSGLLGTLAADVDLGALTLVVEFESGDLIVGLGLEGVRNLEGEAALEESEVTGRLFLDFGAGNWGSDPMGETSVDFEGCGNVDIIKAQLDEKKYSQSSFRSVWFVFAGQQMACAFAKEMIRPFKRTSERSKSRENYI